MLIFFSLELYIFNSLNISKYFHEFLSIFSILAVGLNNHLKYRVISLKNDLIL